LCSLLQSPATFSLLCLNILSSTLFSNTFNFFSVRVGILVKVYTCTFSRSPVVPSIIHP
jgi:hypothetical protein